jgi:hypothetical protein
MGIFFIFAIIIAVVVLVAILGAMAARKRTEELRQVAHALGLSFIEGTDSSFDERYPFLDKLCQGSNRYAYNIISGQYRNHSVTVFDYHYETYWTDSKGRRQTNHHYFSFLLLLHPQNFPELVICREGWFDKLVQFFGFDDINFESAEFSRTFHVRCRDKRFAYDICHAKMIEYMLDNRDLNIEMERNCLTLFFSRQLSAAQIPANLDRLVAIREMFPNYLMRG